MDKRPTLTDVARRAGVSYATADRVVNDRGGVAEKSVRRVREAVEALGYVRNAAAAHLSQGRRLRFAVVLPEGENAFFARMREAFARLAAGLHAEGAELRPTSVPAFDAAALAAHLHGLADEDVAGVALVGIDDPRVRDALEALRKAGTAAVTLVADVPDAPRDAYVGLDNRMAGATAARMVGLAHGGRSGRVLPILGDRSARDHADRLNGFADCLAARYPKLALAPEIAARDDAARIAAAVTAALDADPRITALYNAGAGNTGLLRALAARSARPVAVLHELVPRTRQALERGEIDVVLDQRPDHEAALAIAHLRAIAERRPLPPPAPVRPEIYVPENLPPDDTAAPDQES